MTSQSAGETGDPPRFTTGSTMRHVIVMATTGALGLLAVFVVDLVNLLYISLLGDPRLTAAVGFATTVIFFFISLSVGLMIAGTALVSRALGAGDRVRARRLAGSAIFLMIAVTGALSILVLPFARPLLSLLGAEGETLDTAQMFLLIVLPATPLLGVFMGLSGILRATGDARRAMVLTLIFGLTTAILDPIFIFVFGWGVTGAAIVAVIARVATVAYGLYAVVKVHDLIERPGLSNVVADFRPLVAIGGPAVLTNIATPVGNGYVTAAISEFGDPAVAGWTIVSRVAPVAFVALFSLSGAIGPILGQNYGARQFDRVRGALTNAVMFSAVYLVAISVILYLARDGIVWAFGVDGEAAELVIFFCSGIATVYGFMAGLFVANAAFNNLGYPLLSTLLNWGRATLGTVPFVLVGAHYAQAKGALAGFSLGSVPFGILALIGCYAVIRRIGEPGHGSPTSLQTGGGHGSVDVTKPADRPSR